MVSDTQPQKRAILSDCDSSITGLVGGLHSDLGVHSDLAIGLHGHSSYAPAYSSGYLASGGIVGSVGHLGALVSSGYASHAPIISSGYASHAPLLASSVISSPIVSHAPVIAAPAVYIHFNLYMKIGVFFSILTNTIQFI